jgi:thiol-disulfide isomerase/thioredoxin
MTVGRRLVCVICAALAASTSAGAQSLAELARKTGEKKAGSSNPLVFDERDLNPALARRELYEVKIDEPRWKRFVAADRAVSRLLESDAAVLKRLETLNGASVRALERFFQREPALLEALTISGTTPSEHAFTQLAMVLALEEGADGAEQIEGLPPSVQSNIAFLKGHQQDVAALPERTTRLTVRVAPPAGAVVAAAVDTSAPPPTAKADAGGLSGTGPEVPDFAFVDFTGARRTLAEFRGRYVLLDFWGSWCGPCRREVPFMKAAYAQFRSRGLEVIGMDYEQGATEQQVRAYLQDQGVTWTFATPDSVNDVIMNQFQISSFPTLWLLDREGRLLETRSAMLRGEQLARTLDVVLPR